MKDIAVQTKNFNLWYGDFQALFDINLSIKQGIITSMIGPSGCGKSTLLRSMNRIIDRLDYVRTTGEIHILQHDIFDPKVELVQLRKKVGMVFQRPNPLPLSIRENILFGHRIHSGGKRSTKDEENEIVEQSLKTVLLWEKTKDKLDHSATKLSLEEQQKLCIARLLPLKPTVLLMDEPCSALDPKGTEAVEELIWTLRGEYTIIMVTHNMAQARRASDECIFMLMGKLMEHSPTTDMFVTPKHEKTAAYIEGRYG